MAPEIVLNHWQAGLLYILKPQSLPSEIDGVLDTELCKESETSLALALGVRAQQIFTMEKALQEALCKNRDLEKQNDALRASADQLEQELLMKDMQCAGLEAKCEAMENMEAKDAASPKQEGLTEELDAKSGKLLQVEQELLNLKTDMQTWMPYWDGKEFIVQDLHRQVTFLQQWRCAIFINQQNILRQRKQEAEYDEASIAGRSMAHSKASMSKEQILAIKRLARESSVATETEVLLLQQLTDVWKLRLEVMVHGLDDIPPEWPFFIPDINRTKARWIAMKEELRLQVGLPGQPRATHRQSKHKQNNDRTPDIEPHAESDQKEDDDERYDAVSNPKERLVGSTDDNHLGRRQNKAIRQMTMHHQEAKQFRGSGRKAIIQANGDMQYQTKVFPNYRAISEIQPGGNGGVGHYPSDHGRRMHIPHHEDPSFGFLSSQPMQQPPEPPPGPPPHPSKHNQTLLYSQQHYQDWHYAAY